MTDPRDTVSILDTVDHGLALWAESLVETGATVGEIIELLDAAAAKLRGRG